MDSYTQFSYWLRSYTADGRTVDNRVDGCASAWEALDTLARAIKHHPSAFVPMRVDVLTEEPPDWRG